MDPKGLDAPKEQTPEHQRMQHCMERILADEVLAKAAREDSIFTFQKLGMPADEASRLFDFIQEQFLRGKTASNLSDIEVAIFKKFKETKIGDQTLVQKLDQALSKRAQIITDQVSPHLDPTKGILDFGTGDGDVSYNLKQREKGGKHFRIDAAVDVIDYRKQPPARQEPLPFQRYDGTHLSFGDRAFDQAIMTNVAHHAGETNDGNGPTKDNEPMLRELCRVTKDKIVVIETIPDPALIKSSGLPVAYERTRWNDYLYNRLFHAFVGHEKRTDIPVPGRYETAEGWVERFKKLGWRPSAIEHLGYDQPSISDYHILYVFERDPNFESPEGIRTDVRGTLASVL